MLWAVDVLGSQLRALGVREGGVLMVHASMRRVGKVVGGADGLLDAMLAVLGRGGTLVMVLGADADFAFSVDKTPVDVEEMGILAEVFRRRAGVVLSDHAASRYAAYGPRAAALLEDTPLHDYHGPGSVLEGLTREGGQVLRLGADVDSLTLTHWAEYLAQVPHKRRVRRRYLREDCGEQWIESLDDDDGIVEWPHGDYFSQLLLDFLAEGRASVGPVGGCQAELLHAQDFIAFAVAWMERELGA